MITQAEVRALFHYDPQTGSLTYVKNPPHHKGKVGCEAGWTNHRGYKRLSINGQDLPMHHIIWLWMTGMIPVEIDHKDGDRGNNRWSNLRSTTRSQNLMNQGKKPNNTSGYKGVCSRGNSHAVRFRTHGRVIHVGSFPTAREAAEAYDHEVVKHQGQFAKTNKALGLI